MAVPAEASSDSSAGRAMKNFCETPGFQKPSQNFNGLEKTNKIYFFKN